MEKANFLDWFKKLFLQAVQHLLPQPGVIFFVNGHHSLELIEVAREKGVHLISFSPLMSESTIH